MLEAPDLAGGHDPPVGPARGWVRGPRGKSGLRTASGDRQATFACNWSRGSYVVRDRLLHSHRIDVWQQHRSEAAG